MTPDLFDARRCQLGEGPMWHPERKQFFWFDILGKKLLSRSGNKTLHWDLPVISTAAGWVDRGRIVIFSEIGIHLFDIDSGTSDLVAPMEAGNDITRSNDGRADPYGGFWIGTMGKHAEPRAGRIWRYYRGELRSIFHGMTIPNAICFSPDGGRAFFADSVDKTVRSVRLGARGWPVGDADIWLDLRADKLTPDGAVIDTDGIFWNAQWGAGRIAGYDRQGKFLMAVEMPAAHTTCPAFGGEDRQTMIVTSAMEGRSTDELDANPAHGQTFLAEGLATGQAEHQVIL